MPKTDTSEENGSPKRRYIPRPCILCTLNIRDHYLDELEAEIQMWVEMSLPATDTLPSGLTEEKKSRGWANIRLEADGGRGTTACFKRRPGWAA